MAIPAHHIPYDIMRNFFLCEWLKFVFQILMSVGRTRTTVKISVRILWGVTTALAQIQS